MLRTAFHLAGNLLALVTGFGLLARFVPPDVWWPPAIIALLLPGLLLATFIFLLIALFKRKRKWALLPLAVFLFSLPLLPRLFSMGANQQATTEELTVMTANVRGFKNESWKLLSSVDALRFLEKTNPDILLLQEARSDRSRFPLFDEIKSGSGLKKRHQPSRKTMATYANEVTFIADVFPHQKAFNGYLITDVETRVGTVRVINAHLQTNRISGMAGEIGQDSTLAEGLDRAESMFRNYGASAAVRAQQAQGIRKAIKESPHPVIVGGDFNDVPSSYTYQRILTPRLRDAWAEAGSGMGTTFTGPLPGLRIDFLLVDTSLQILSVERIETGYSDHRALRAELGRKTNRPD